MSGQRWLKADSLLGVAVVATGLTLGALAIAIWRLVCGQQMEAANWVMAAGGLGLIVFSAVQLHREAQREAERVAAARAKLKPVAWLARRMCEQAVIESGNRHMNQWLARWYIAPRQRMVEGGDLPNTIDVLQDLMRETVTLAAEAAKKEADAADSAFSAFIVAANLLNELNAENPGFADTTVYQAAIPRARKAATQLATAARALIPLAPRGTEEPPVPATPKFADER